MFCLVFLDGTSELGNLERDQILNLDVKPTCGYEEMMIRTVCLYRMIVPYHTYLG